MRLDRPCTLSATCTSVMMSQDQKCRQIESIGVPLLLLRPNRAATGCQGLKEKMATSFILLNTRGATTANDGPSRSVHLERRLLGKGSHFCVPVFAVRMCVRVSSSLEQRLQKLGVAMRAVVMRAGRAFKGG